MRKAKPPPRKTWRAPRRPWPASRSPSNCAICKRWSKSAPKRIRQLCSRFRWIYSPLYDECSTNLLAQRRLLPRTHKLPKNEDGEFELVLGNKQLLSMFFVVVILLGVFFVMGYIVGRNSAPLTNAEPSIAHKADAKPMVVDSPAPKSAETQTAPAPEPSKPLETATEKPAETKPAPPPAELPK